MKYRATAPNHKPIQKPTLSIPNLTIRPLEASKLISCQPYQRPVNKKNCDCIKTGYIKELVNPIKVSLRNGKYYVFDGQHTLTVLTEMFGENCTVPCLVYCGLTYEREAELFAKQDEFKKKLDIREQVKAQYESKDEEIVRFVKAVEECGYKCRFNGGGRNEGVGNIRYLLDHVYRTKGEEHMKRILHIIKAAWPEEHSATSDPIIKGVDIFVSLYDGEFSDTDLVSKLQKIAPIVIIRNGKADMTHSGAIRFAIQIFDQYNKGKNKGKLRSKF